MNRDNLAGFPAATSLPTRRRALPSAIVLVRQCCSVGPKRVDAEEVRDITSGPMSDAEKTRLENWYEPVFSKLPLPIGRLLCQRTNAAYDMRVRKTYSGILLSVAVLLVVVLTCIGLHQGLTVNELVLTMYLEYRGVHFVEAFLIRKRDNRLVGQSEPFYVVIE